MKKRYEKPNAIDLSGRSASGQVRPLACMSGSSVSPITCSIGSLDTACYTGSSGSTYGSDCIPGTAAAPSASCLPGTSATYECAAGNSPVYSGSCTVGPSN
jgi:hypothetical protein